MKKLIAILAPILSLLLTGVVYAGPVDWAVGKVEQSVVGFISMTAAAFVKSFALFLTAILVPANLWLGIPALALTMSLLILVPSMKNAVGRLSGLIWAVIIGVGIMQSFTAVVQSMPSAGKVVIILFAIFFAALALIPVRFLGKNLFAMTKSGFSKASPGSFACITGALLVACLLNGRSVSNAGNFYVPSILCAITGAVFLVNRAYVWRKKKTALVAATNPVASKR